jgi:hypothetical protein
MSAHPILQPAIALVLWSLVMLIWMAVTRFSAFGKAGVDLSKAKPGGRGQDLDGVLPDKTQWKAHNYMHLMEQPTLFYAIAAFIAIANLPNPILVSLAWAYVALRVLHSIWQAIVNSIPVRFTLFLISTLCLLAMAIVAAVEVF